MTLGSCACESRVDVGAFDNPFLLLCFPLVLKLMEHIGQKWLIFFLYSKLLLLEVLKDLFRLSLINYFMVVLQGKSRRLIADLPDLHCIGLRLKLSLRVVAHYLLLMCPVYDLSVLFWSQFSLEHNF